MARAAFLDKTLLAIADLSEQAVFSEAYARERGLLQSLDVRIRLVTVAALLVLVSALHRPVLLAGLYGFSALLAALSGVPLSYFLKRVWSFVPLFTAAIVLPALLNIVTPGEPLLVVLRLERAYEWGPYRLPEEIAVTRQGLWGGILLLVRVAASVSFAVLLTLTTRWSDIFAGLRSLFVPRIVIMTLAMTYRYLFILLRLVQDMYRARSSRTIVPGGPSGQRNWVASRIGLLFRRSMLLSRQVAHAMVSRGYRGEHALGVPFRPQGRDLGWCLLIVILTVILIGLDGGGSR